MLIGALQHGSCVIQPTKIAFSSEELIDMIHRCQLNCLNQFSTFLSIHLRDSQQNHKLLGYLQSLDQTPLDVLGDWGHKVVRFLVSPIAFQTFSSLTVVLCLDLARH